MRVDSKTDEALQPEHLYVVSSWCNSGWKRAFDLFGATLLLIVLLPVILVVALAVKVTSPGPVLFRQGRPGKHDREFLVFKFRTMIDRRDDAGPVLTRACDPRVTRVGAFMRKWKLDELPQLFNVLRGEMSFVGPRPQPTKLWRQPSIRKEASCVLSVRPGITGQATLSFRNEEELLAPLSSEQVEEVYMRSIMPLKLKMDIDYLQRASASGDLRIIAKTALRLFHRRQEADDLLIKESMAVLEEKKQMRS